ncbi:MAG: hypothetical protein KJO36_06045 [Acidimicrobiia bacterium]|nr:hypothetical protein [Acidimicrobiia bacterium]
MAPAIPVLNRDLYVVINTDDRSDPLEYGRRTLTDEMLGAAIGMGVKVAVMPYAWELGVNQSSGELDEAKLESWLLAKMPETNDERPLVIPDIEGEIKTALHGDSTAIPQTLAWDTYATVIDKIRDHVPGAEIAFYGVPTTYPWIGRRTQEEAIADAVEALKDLPVDHWCPVMYDTALEAEDSAAFSAAALEWKTSMMTCSRILAAEHGGRILPMIWERIDSRRSVGHRELIPDEELIRDQILLSLDGGADGLVWWGKSERVLAQGGWPTWGDCKDMTRADATEYLLTDSPRRLLDLIVPICKNYDIG